MHVLLDEASCSSRTSRTRTPCLRLVDAFPRLLVFRTFSKIYGLSGLRAGYAVGSASAGELLDALAPALGVNALTQAAVEQACGSATPRSQRRRLARDRAAHGRILTALHDLPVDAPEPGQLRLAARRGLTGAELPGRLERPA